jgi:DNA polymerase-3 subunit alpha/DNA polymerase-3 subunit epsilon
MSTLRIEPSDPCEWPYAVQLSYIVYDTVTHEKKVVNQKIRLPKGVLMCPGSEAIHKMSLQENQTSGYPYIQDVLLDAKADFDKADHIVAHNLAFDRNVMLAELKRHAGTHPLLETFLYQFEYNSRKKAFCTGKHGATVCKIEAVNCHGKPYYKMPKLAYLYEYLFGESPDPTKLHDALYDVFVCLRCYYSITVGRDLVKDNPPLYRDVYFIKRMSQRLLEKPRVRYYI